MQVPTLPLCCQSKTVPWQPFQSAGLHPAATLSAVHAHTTGICSKARGVCPKDSKQKHTTVHARMGVIAFVALNVLPLYLLPVT